MLWRRPRVVATRVAAAAAVQQPMRRQWRRKNSLSTAEDASPKLIIDEATLDTVEGEAAAVPAVPAVPAGLAGLAVLPTSSEYSSPSRPLFCLMSTKCVPAVMSITK